jgi:hypothetical protein
MFTSWGALAVGRPEEVACPGIGARAVVGSGGVVMLQLFGDSGGDVKSDAVSGFGAFVVARIAAACAWSGASPANNKIERDHY